MKRDYTEDKELFIQALTEGINARFDRILSESPMDAKCSRKHLKNIGRILKVKSEIQISRKLTPAKLIAIIVAIIIVLTGCIVFRHKIAGFVEYIRETYLFVIDDEVDRRETIKTPYKFTYNPQGFDLVYQSDTPEMIVYKWENNRGQHMKITQSSTTSLFLIDVTEGYTNYLIHNDLDVYYRKNENRHFYIWHNNSDSFKLYSQIELSKIEIIQILDGMVIK